MNKILTFPRSLFLLGALVFLTLSACSRNTEFDDRGGKGSDKTIVVFELADGATYAISDTEDDAVSEVDILLFNPKNELINVNPIVGVFTQTGRKVEVTTTLTTLAYGNIVLLANARAMTTGVPFTEKMSYDDAMELIQLNLPGKWNTDSSSGTYVNIPMYGETGYVTVSTTNNKFNTTLRRMLYRVDVNIMASAQSDFKLTSVHVYNRDSLGMLRPSKVAGKPSMPSTPAKAVASLIYKDGEITTPNVSCEGEIFLMESLIASELNDTIRLENALCLVVGGKYKAESPTYYYRVDFAMNDTGADAPYPKHFYNTLRNHHYKIKIQAVLGAGELKPGEALDKESTLIKAEVLDWGDGGGIDGDIDGKYVLRLSQGEFTLPYMEHTASSTDNKLTVSSTHPEGWFVEKITGDDASTPPLDSWLGIDLPNSGTPQMDEMMFSLILKENTGSVTRVGYIFIKSGSRMVYKVKVTQRPKIRLRSIAWSDYDDDAQLTFITVEEGEGGSTHTTNIQSTVIQYPIEIVGTIKRVTLTYMDHSLDVPASKWSISEDGTKITVTDRSLIGKPIHLDKIREDMAGSYLQIADINLLGYTNTNGDLNNWVPIGINTPVEAQFSGSYDGGSGYGGTGFTISNLKIDRDILYVGLFGYTSATSVLTKIHIAAGTGSSIKGRASVGGICGFSSGVVTNCSNEASVEATRGFLSNVGGIVGQGANISNCTNKGPVTTAGENMGGICGKQTDSGSLITDCHNLSTGLINVATSTYKVGGIVGHSLGTISYCSNLAPIKGMSYVGGICGNSEGLIEFCDNTVTVEGPDINGFCFGGIVGFGGNIKNCNNTGIITNEGSCVGGIAGVVVTNIENCSNAAAISGTGANSKYVGGIVGGDDDAGDNLRIFNCENLIGGDVKGTNLYVGGIAGNHKGTADVGVCTNAGNVTGEAIVGGLFGHSKAIISAPGNTSTGTVTGVEQVGNICGENYGTISGITNNTSITATGYGIGGIVGRNWGTIKDCTNTATVSDTGTAEIMSSVGGICGSSYGIASDISNCHNRGTISGVKDYVGGIVGKHEGTADVGVCTNAGNVTGTDFVGGLFGSSAATIIGAGNTSTGTVTGVSTVGNICGDNSGKISGITNETSITATGSEVGGIAGKNLGTVEDCRNTASVSGTGTGAPTPTLSHNVGGIVGYGQTANSKIINCHNAAGATISGTGNSVGGICGNHEGTGDVGVCTNTGNIIGKADNTGGLFGSSAATISDSRNTSTGVITGVNVVGNICGASTGEISGITNNTPITSTGSYIGGIAGSSNGTIISCINNATVKGTGETNGSVGGICGKNSGGKIQECENKGAISLTGNQADLVGGIVGDSDGTNASIFKCHNRAGGTVTGKRYTIGGVVGRIATGTVDQCTNNAAVSGTGTVATTGYITNVVGGIAGSVDVVGNSLTNCTNEAGGNVTTPATSENTGGVVGVNRGTVSGSKNFATIVGGQNVGGIAGHTLGAGSSVSNCINEAGTVRAEVSVVGGIVGANAGELKACINKVAVSGPVTVGGINGHTSSAGSITACINQGAISATTDKVGGILGSNSTATVVACYNIASVTGTGAGAIYGYKAGVGAATNCYYGGSSPAALPAEALPFSSANWPKPRPTMTGWELTTESPAGPWASRGTYSPLVYPTLK